jgi:hypothetical protein
MADPERVRIELAYEGGQIMSTFVSIESADELEQALLAGRDDRLALDTEDGRYTVALDRIVYLKRFTRESRVGFTSS